MFIKMEKFMDKNTKMLIENLCNYYNFQIQQFGNKNSYLWGLVDKNNIPNRIFIFFKKSERDNLENILNELKSKNEEKINYIKVLITSNESEINRLEDNIIVFDAKNNNILYVSDYIRNDCREIERIVAFQKSNEKDKKFYIVTYSLIFVNVIVFLISVYLSKDIIDINPNVLEYLGAKDNALISNGQYYRLLTSTFLHSGIIHITMNMYSLFAIGPLVEKYYGRLRYILIYILSGIFASLASFILSPYMSVGASGAIFGVLGATLVMAYKLRERIGKSFLKNVMIVVVVNLIFSFSIPNIDVYAHLGGLVSGVILSGILYREGSL
jgi:rhomboid protease GluP